MFLSWIHGYFILARWRGENIMWVALVLGGCVLVILLGGEKCCTYLVLAVL
jgi:hypothetical protein